MAYFPFCERGHWLARAPISAVFFFAATLASCHRSAPEPVTLSYFRLGWAQPDELPTAEPLSQQFIRETGIQLKNLPVPETTLDQLSLSRKLLESGSGLDVLGVDFIWSGILADDLLDLRPALAAELSSLEPKLIASYEVNGKLVAIPYEVQTGVLEYRSDLLREYGYDHPPKSWDDLERIAEKIQTGERAKGKKDFWGYVWQGADAEALTCNALEWQISQGGGQIIEDDHTISVNNPAAIRSWQRARHWIGWISPPSVLAYRELDSINAFDSGGAVFNRVWGGTTITRGGQSHFFHGRESLAPGQIGYAGIPGSSASSSGGLAGTLGGSGLAVSRNSLHPKEAIELVRFLVRAKIKADLQKEQAAAKDESSAPGYDASQSSGEWHLDIVARPSSMLGAKYESAARAYIAAVHSVLTGEKPAPQAVADLERQLVQITGFTTGPPGKTNQPLQGRKPSNVRSSSKPQ